MVSLSTVKDPPSAFSTDDCSINRAGIKWFPKEDLLALDTGILIFARKQLMRKPVQQQNIISIKLARRNCVSKSLKSLTWEDNSNYYNIEKNFHILDKRGLSRDNFILSAWDQCVFHTSRWCRKMLALDFKDMPYQIFSEYWHKHNRCCKWK